jgi:hypothetical protein
MKLVGLKPDEVASHCLVTSLPSRASVMEGSTHESWVSVEKSLKLIWLLICALLFTGWDGFTRLRGREWALMEALQRIFTHIFSDVWWRPAQWVGKDTALEACTWCMGVMCIPAILARFVPTPFFLFCKLKWTLHGCYPWDIPFLMAWESVFYFGPSSRWSLTCIWAACGVLILGIFGRMMYNASMSLGEMLNFRAYFVHLNFVCGNGR